MMNNKLMDFSDATYDVMMRIWNVAHLWLYYKRLFFIINIILRYFSEFCWLLRDHIISGNIFNFVLTCIVIIVMAFILFFIF